MLNLTEINTLFQNRKIPYTLEVSAINEVSKTTLFFRGTELRVTKVGNNIQIDVKGQDNFLKDSIFHSDVENETELVIGVLRKLNI